LKTSLLKKIFFLLVIICTSLFCFSQKDSCQLRISLLTCSAGEELFTVWGHSALRVTDSSRGTDLVFNYGSFDFDAAGFYIKFARGNMQYFVSTGSFEDFVYEYQYFKRGIIEQPLNLSCTEKQQLATALRENAKEENKYYRYHFLNDNCSSRLRDIVAKNTLTAPVYKKMLTDKKTFWNLIHEGLDQNHKTWSRLGIDILLGSKMDQLSTDKQAMFLPDYLMQGFDSAQIGKKLLVDNKRVILPVENDTNTSAGISPLIAFSILFFVIAICSFIKSIASSLFFVFFDFTLFFTTGLLGLLLLFLWFGRIDTVCGNNYNVLWALPTHAIVALLLNKSKSWLKTYWLITALLLFLTLLLWKWLPQEMNNGLLPFISLLLFRSIIRYKKS
jgi:Domain of unknown function (DUF4105)